MRKKYRYIEKKVKLPNKVETVVQMIDHPGAVLIVPFISQTEVILLKQYRATLGKYIFELPAGTLERGEKTNVCARRELMEETGFKAGKIKKLGDIYPVPGYSNEIIHVYRADQLSECEIAKDEDEIIEVVVCNKRKIKELFGTKKIRDAKTISALAMCGWLK